jgi:hypothetical protein
MSAATLDGKLLLLLTVILLSACSLTQAPDNQEELQHAALIRWGDCIERHQDMHKHLAADLHKMVSVRCEGHQRDVLATFPVHLENQVGSLLSERSSNMTTERFLRSGNSATWNITQSTHVDTLKLRSSSPLPDDL